MPRYLDQSMRSFIHNQERMRQYMQSALGGIFPFNQFEEMGKQNIAMVEQAMRMFAPFAGDQGKKAPSGSAAAAAGGAPQDDPGKLDDLQKKGWVEA